LPRLSLKTPSEEDQAVLAAVQRPIAPACISVPVGRPLWKDVTSWYLLAEQDRMIVVERMKARVSEHPVDQTRSVTAPGPVVLAVRHPDRITAIISQNGNAYEEGLSDGWNPIQAYWQDASPATARRCAPS
jgi:hypothetical protein